MRNFEAIVLPHMNAAYNLARWLVRDDTIAEDIVQDSFLRAFRYFDSLREGDAKPWLLGIVRNNCFTWLEERRNRPGHVAFDDELHDSSPAPSPVDDPVMRLDQQRQRTRVDAAIRALAPPFREVIVLRELEDLSYAEIAQIASIPIGTVMSRLSRARAELKLVLADARGRD